MLSKTACLFQLDHWISQEWLPYIVRCDVDAHAGKYSLMSEEEKEVIGFA